MSPEFSNESRLEPILAEFGEVKVMNHEGNAQTLASAVIECPPFVDALLNASSSEELHQIINALRMPEN